VIVPKSRQFWVLDNPESIDNLGVEAVMIKKNWFVVYAGCTGQIDDTSKEDLVVVDVQNDAKSL